MSLVLGIPLGLVMGRCKNRWPDKLGTALIVLIQAVPAAVYFLYIQMYGTSVLGVGLLFDAANWRYWVLPVCSMSLANLAFYAMWLRRYMVDESNKDYVKLARAKGVSESNIALHHVFRNAMVPLVPSVFSNSFSMIGALVLGDFAVQAHWLVPEVLAYMAFVAIANFAQPSYELGYAFKLLRLVLLVSSAALGWVGLALGTLLIIVLLVTTRPIAGGHYMYPIYPFNWHALRALLIRRPIAPDNT